MNDNPDAKQDTGETQVVKLEPTVDKTVVDGSHLAEDTQVVPVTDTQVVPVTDTQIVPAADDQAPEFPYLIVTQGEEDPREIDLIADKLSMGRGENNDLILPDIACSRYHSVLEKQDNDYLVRDLESGNGTLVNGEKVLQHVLQHGDEIKIGNTVLQFNSPHQTPAAAMTNTIVNGQTVGPESREKNTSRKLLLFGGGGVIGLFIVLAILKFWMAPPKPQGQSPAQIQRQKNLRTQQEFKGQMQQVAKTVKDQNWPKAELFVQMALKIRPTDEIALDYLKFIQREKSSKQALLAALESFTKNEYPRTMALLRQVDQESASFPEASQLKKRTRLAIDNALIEAANELLSAKEYEKALAKLKEVLKANANHELASKLKKEVLQEQEEEQERERKRLIAKALRDKRLKDWKARQEREKDPKVIAEKEALALYQKGELAQAIALAQKEDLQQRVKTLHDFQAAYEQGKKLAKNMGQANKAKKSLLLAWKINQKISEKDGHYYLELRKELAKLCFILGMDAMMGERLPSAYKNFVAAKGFGSNKSIKQLLTLEQKAKELFRKAYMIKDKDPDLAVKYLDIAMQIVPATHEIYKKAKNLRASILGPSDYETEGDSGF